MIIGSWTGSEIRIRERQDNSPFTRTVADRPGIRTVSHPLQSVRFTVGSLIAQVLNGMYVAGRKHSHFHRCFLPNQSHGTNVPLPNVCCLYHAPFTPPLLSLHVLFWKSCSWKWRGSCSRGIGWDFFRSIY